MLNLLGQTTTLPLDADYLLLLLAIVAGWGITHKKSQRRSIDSMISTVFLCSLVALVGLRLMAIKPGFITSIFVFAGQIGSVLVICACFMHHYNESPQSKRSAEDSSMNDKERA